MEIVKETIYDELISPLMAQIIDICQRHKIALLANFNLDNEGDGLCVTTSLLGGEYDPSENQLEAVEILYPAMWAEGAAVGDAWTAAAVNAAAREVRDKRAMPAGQRSTWERVDVAGYGLQLRRRLRRCEMNTCRKPRS